MQGFCWKCAGMHLANEIILCQCEGCTHCKKGDATRSQCERRWTPNKTMCSKCATTAATTNARAPVYSRGNRGGVARTASTQPDITDDTPPPPPPHSQPRASGTCACPGEDECRRKQKHKPGECTALAQNARKFAGRCRACAPEQREQCTCAEGEDCRQIVKHAPGACTAPRQIGRKFAGRCVACAPEQREQCTCAGGEDCHRKLKHAPGACTARRQISPEFAGRCGACAPEQRGQCTCPGGADCTHTVKHAPGACTTPRQIGREFAGLCALCASHRLVPCMCPGRGPCEGIHGERFGSTMTSVLRPCDGRSQPGKVCEQCQLRRLFPGSTKNIVQPACVTMKVDSTGSPSCLAPKAAGPLRGCGLVSHKRKEDQKTLEANPADVKLGRGSGEVREARPDCVKLGPFSGETSTGTYSG